MRLSARRLLGAVAVVLGAVLLLTWHNSARLVRPSLPAWAVLGAWDAARDEPRDVGGAHGGGRRDGDHVGQTGISGGRGEGKQVRAGGGIEYQNIQDGMRGRGGTGVGWQASDKDGRRHLGGLEQGHRVGGQARGALQTQGRPGYHRPSQSTTHARAFHLASSTTTTISNVTSRISAKPNPPAVLFNIVAKPNDKRGLFTPKDMLALALARNEEQNIRNVDRFPVVKIKGRRRENRERKER